MLVNRYTIFTAIRRLEVPGASKGANVFWMLRAARMGVLKRVKTMKMEKIWSVLPVIYMPVGRQCELWRKGRVAVRKSG